MQNLKETPVLEVYLYAMGCVCTSPKIDVDPHSSDGPTQTQHQTDPYALPTKQLTNDQDKKKKQRSDVEEKQQAPALVCKFGNVINGMIPLCIENLSDVIIKTVEIFNMDQDGDTKYNKWNINLFIASSPSNYNNKDATQVTQQLEEEQEWQKYTKNATPKTNDHIYFIKVPFYFQSYYIVAKIELEHINKLNCVTGMSDVYKINIPSFLIDPKIEIGKLILYRVKDKTFATNGRVVEILKNDESGFDYIVEDEYEKDVNGEKKRCKVNIGDIFEDSKLLCLTFDICSMLDKNNMNIHRYNAECDLVLKSSDKNLRQYYWQLRNMIASIIPINLKFESRINTEFTYNFEYIGALLSKTIMDYLYFDNINDIDNYKFDCNYNDISYKMRCFVDSSHKKHTVDGYDVGYMFVMNHWKQKIIRTRVLLKNGLGVAPVQSFKEFWSCDLCSFGINSHDWICHCIPIESIIAEQEGHGYCLQCTYSMANGIAQCEKSLQNIVHQYIDPQFTMDCIRLIVAFTVGSVTISRHVDN